MDAFSRSISRFYAAAALAALCACTQGPTPVDPETGLPTPTTVNDVTVARYNAAGVVQWSHTYDSGPWLNYEYPTGQGAVDYGRDVWPLPDGGFWVVADSIANLNDVHDIGFDGPNNLSARFIHARSVFVMPLDADGNVRFSNRLTEHAF